MVQSKISEAVRDVTTISAPATMVGTAGGGLVGYLSENAIVIGLSLTAAQIALNVGLNWYYKHQTLKHMKTNKSSGGG